MKLILVRHGESISNVLKINDGPKINNGLSPEGLRQTKKLGLRLRNEKLDRIYSSDFKRAKQTTKAIIKYHKKIPVEYVKDLREIDPGVLAGKKYNPTDWIIPPKKCESSSHAQKRVKRFLDRVYKKYPEKTILFVAHSFINRALITALFNQSFDMMHSYGQSNTSVSIFELKEDNKHRIHLLNCVKHLEK